MPEGTYSVIGVPRAGRLEMAERLKASPPIAPGDVEPAALVAEAQEAIPEVDRAWIAWVMIGLMLLIRPSTKRFRLFDRITDLPSGRRLLMTAGLAAVITLTIGALLPK